MSIGLRVTGILSACLTLVAISLGFVGSVTVADEASTPQFGLDTLPQNTLCVAPPRPVAGTVSFPAVIDHWPGPSGVLTTMLQQPNQPTFWLVGDRSGVIYRYARGPAFTRLGQFADLRDRVSTSWAGSNFMELGMLGAAFDPDFAANGYVYVYYTAVGDTPGSATLARLSRFSSRDGGLTLDKGTEQVLLTVTHTTQVHRGAALFFGADGYLYIGLGDGGVRATAQDLRDLRGKMLRIDVRAAAGYGIPPDNPFVTTPGARGEIYALGFRNPWRWSFNRDTGEIWLGDVGQSLWEEIDVVGKGGNYGWSIREGANCYAASTCRTQGLIDPVYQYRHEGQPAAVIGGFFYTGSSLPGLQGLYVLGDVQNSQVSVLEPDESGLLQPRVLGAVPGSVFSFAQDADGELYVLSSGRVHKVSPPSGGGGTFPQTLSQTGCTDAQNPTLPAPGLIPYRVNMPLWSDGAEKVRWMALPPGGKIGVGTNGDWVFPIGTVLIKHFRLQAKLVETRLFMRHDDGDWGGYSYEWNDEQTEATLLAGAKLKAVGNQQWLFPSRSQCMQCHTTAAGRSLGLETPQLNGSMLYPQTGRTANQIATLAHLGLFDTPMSAPAALPAFPALDDATKPVQARARAYLHANCSICHRPEGPGQGPQDFRYFIPGTQMQVYNVNPTQGDFGIQGAKLYAPGDPGHSMIALRMHTLQPGRMPPLASRLVHQAGTQVIDQWIRSGLGFGVPDADADGYADNVDNCPLQVNADQRDTDADHHGNRCDADLNNDGIVNGLDLTLFKQRFGTSNPDADLNGDGIVNAIDLGALKTLFGKPPGS